MFLQIQLQFNRENSLLSAKMIEDVHQSFRKKNTKKIDEEFLMKTLANNVMTNSKVVLGIFDFGGQDVFMVIHHLFLTLFGFYIIVFNMEDLRGGAETQEKCKKYLFFWVNSILMHTLRKQGDGFLVAPFAFVGTHKDTVSSEADHIAISDFLEEEFGRNQAWNFMVHNG